MSTSTPERDIASSAGDGGGQSRLLTWPNVLTLGRIVLIPILVGSFYISGSDGLWLGFAVFVLAAVTDFFDGWLARRLDQHSTLGRVLDPIADKLIVAAALVMLTAFDRAPAIAVVAILSREFLIAGLREALAGTVTLPVHWLAKWKTAVQMTAIALLFVAPALSDAVPVLARVGDALLWLAVALTWVTGIGYLRAALRHILAPTSGPK